MARVQINPEAKKVFHMSIKVSTISPIPIKINSSVTQSPGPEIPSGYMSNIVVPIVLGAIALGFAFVLFFIISDTLCRKRCRRKYEALDESSEHGSENESFETKKFLYDAYKGFQISDNDSPSSNSSNSHPMDAATTQIQDPRDIPSTSALNPFTDDKDQPPKSQSVKEGDLLNPFLNPAIKEEEETEDEAASIGQGDDYYSPGSYRVNGLALKDSETEGYNPFLSTEDDIAHHSSSEGSESECYTPFDTDVESDVYDSYDPKLNPFSDKKGRELTFYKRR